MSGLAETGPAPWPAEREDLAAVFDAYLAALLAPDARAARALLLDAVRDGVPAARLYLDVVHPAMHEVGRLWEGAQLSVAQEHLATQVTQTVLAQLALELTGTAASGTGRWAIVACTPGERHALGGQMVADFLEADGWEVLALGADVPPEEVARLAGERDVALVTLSTALPGNLLAAGRACALLRRLAERPLVVVGGQAYAGNRQRALAVGADEFAPDPESLLRLLAERFGARVGAAAGG